MVQPHKPQNKGDIFSNLGACGLEEIEKATEVIPSAVSWGLQTFPDNKTLSTLTDLGPPALGLAVGAYEPKDC